MFIIVSISNAQEFKIVKSGPSVANPGDIITYIIAVKSDGTIAQEVLITDYLPSDNTMTYVSSSPSGNYNKETNTITWDKNNFPEIANLGTDELYLKVSVRAGVIKSGKYSVPENLSILTSYAVISGEKSSHVIKSNIVKTDVPRSGGAVLPVE
jgi:uncharacterized repeat protein (TIGR01451 family)